MLYYFTALSSEPPLQTKQSEWPRCHLKISLPKRRILLHTPLLVLPLLIHFVVGREKQKPGLLYMLYVKRALPLLHCSSLRDYTQQPKGPLWPGSDGGTSPGPFVSSGGGLFKGADRDAGSSWITDEAPFTPLWLQKNPPWSASNLATFSLTEWKITCFNLETEGPRQWWRFKERTWH